MNFLHGRRYYLMRWSGYESEPTWEPASSIMKDSASQKDIKDFMSAYQPPRSGRAARQRREGRRKECRAALPVEASNVMLVVDSYSINGVYPLLFYTAFLFIIMLFPEEILPEDLEHGTWTPDVSLEPGLQTAGVQMWFSEQRMLL